MTSEIPDGPWSLGQGECDGKPMFVRINTGASLLAGKPRFEQRVGVSVPFRSPNANGFPRPEEGRVLDAIEDQLVDALTAAGAGIFVLAVTTAGMREFVFYTSDATASQSQVEKVAQAIGSHTLQHVVEHDAEWDVFQQFVESTDVE
ncbi:MAG: hypothetical protein RL033_1104 [Pseudomonadota bacterium]|jgi:hypothetical protein